MWRAALRDVCSYRPSSCVRACRSVYLVFGWHASPSLSVFFNCHSSNAVTASAQEAARRLVFALVSAIVIYVSCVGKENAEDSRKLKYAEDAINSSDPFASEPVVDADVRELRYGVVWRNQRVRVSQAIHWISDRSPDEVMAFREQMISSLESASASMRESGLCEDWLASGDCYAQRISRDVNGQLFGQLLSAAGYGDIGCVDLLRHGAPLMGDLERSGVGVPVVNGPAGSSERLRSDCARRNADLIRSLHEESDASELLDLTRGDAALGRMSEPVALGTEVPSDILLNPRFGVRQLKPDGSEKLRAVDNFSWSSCADQRANSVNGHTAAHESMKHDTLDALASAMAFFIAVTGQIPGLLKADIDAAFRRVPVQAADRWACGIAFLVRGLVSDMFCGIRVRGYCLCCVRYTCQFMQQRHLARWRQSTHGRELEGKSYL